MTDPKICRDCRHCVVKQVSYLDYTERCMAVKPGYSINLVTGYYEKVDDPYAARKPGGDCGPEGRLWEPVPEQIPEDDLRRCQTGTAEAGPASPRTFLGIRIPHWW